MADVTFTCVTSDGAPAVCFRCGKPATSFYNTSATAASSVPMNMQPVCDEHNPYRHLTLTVASSAEPQPRAVIQAFARLMEGKLARNDHKGDWRGMSKAELIYRLSQEYSELVEAIADGALPADIADECADVSLFAMFIADVVGALPGERDERGHDPTPCTVKMAKFDTREVW